VLFLSMAAITTDSMDTKVLFDRMDSRFKRDVEDCIESICDEHCLNYEETNDRSEIIKYLISEFEGNWMQLEDVNLEKIFGLAIDDKNGFRSVSNRSTPRNLDGRLSRASSKSAAGDQSKIYVGGLRCEFEVFLVKNDDNLQEPAYYLKIIKILSGEKDTEQYQIFVENNIDLENDSIKIRLYTGKHDISKKMKEVYESINVSEKRINSIVMEGIFRHFSLTYGNYKAIAMVTSWTDQIRIVDDKYKEKSNNSADYSGSALSGTKASWGKKNESAETLEEQLKKLKELTAKTEKRLAEKHFQKKNKKQLDEINHRYYVDRDEAVAAFEEAAKKYSQEKKTYEVRLKQAESNKKAEIAELYEKNDE
jgi:hypothetical protein